MTDSEKLDLLLEKVNGLDEKVNGLDEKVTSLEQNIIEVKADLKQTERVLKNEIRKECGLVLDEVERVHDILDKHKADKSVHTA